MCDRDASEMQNLSEDFNRRHARPIRPRSEVAEPEQKENCSSRARQPMILGSMPGLFPLSWARPGQCFLGCGVGMGGWAGHGWLGREQSM